MKNLFIDSWYWLKSLPKGVWILVVLALIFGLIIGHQPGGQSMKGEDVHNHASEEVQLWTCSMHPQIRLPEPGQCPICGMDLIPLVTDSQSELGPDALKLSDTAAKLANIVTATVKRGPAEAKVRLSGKIQPDERKIKSITAWVPGRIEKLFVDFTGTEVKAGDPLIELYSPVLYTAQEELLQALVLSKSDSSRLHDSGQLMVNAVREKLSQLGLTSQQIQEVEKRGTASDRLVISSPISGIVIHKNALEGRYVDKGTPIYTITDLSTVWVVLDAYEKDVGFLKEGQLVQFNAEALPGRTFESKVAFINPVLDDKTRSVEVRLNVSNQDGSLKPGLFVRAVVDAKLPHRGQEPILVPATAVLKTGKRAVVYVQKPDTASWVFQGREVILGPRVGNYYEVVSGLSEGEVVVVNGNFKIDSAFQIQAKPSMMNPKTEESDTDRDATSSQKKNSEMSMDAKSLVVPTAFREALQPVYDDYLKAQEALSNDDFKKAQKALVDLRQAVSAVKTPEGHAGHFWMGIQTQITRLTKHAHHWSDIETVRKAFSKIGTQIIDLEQTFGHSGEEVLYRAYCPMAFNNAGAEWVQRDSLIHNPYFGSKMLTCGEIRGTYEAK